MSLLMIGCRSRGRGLHVSPRLCTSVRRDGNISIGKVKIGNSHEFRVSLKILSKQTMMSEEIMKSTVGSFSLTSFPLKRIAGSNGSPGQSSHAFLSDTRYPILFDPQHHPLTPDRVTCQSISPGNSSFVDVAPPTHATMGVPLAPRPVSPFGCCGCC